MIVTLKMNIQDQEIPLKANLTNYAGRIYRQQYGRDLLKDMSEIYKKIHKSPFEGIDLSGIKLTGLSEDEISEELMKRVDLASLLDSQTDREILDFDEVERGGQILWAFVKNADRNLAEYEEWIDSFDFVLPIGDIITALYESWTKSARPTVELKN
jgi:hypothetical protein